MSAKKGSASEQKTRELLIEAAKRVFADKGYEGASVKDLADAAGVNVSLISYYFQGKEGLFKTCIEDFGGESLAAAERALKPPKSREEFCTRLQVFVEEFVALNLRDEFVFRMAHRELVTLNSLEILQERVGKVLDRLAEFIRAANEAGFGRKDMDPQLSARILFGGLLHLIHAHHARRHFGNKSVLNPKSLEKTLNHFVRLSTDGVLVEGKHDESI